MNWVVDFYHQRRALLAQHPPITPRGRPSLFERAEHTGGQDGSGWILYRIAKVASVIPKP